MRNRKVVNLKKEFNEWQLSDMALDIVENYDDYFCDAISEEADQNVDCYNSDLAEWLLKNDYYVNEAVKEFGIDNKNFDIWRLIQQGQYISNERELYEQTEQIWICKALYYLMDKGIKELEENIYEELKNECYCMDNDDKLCYITEWCDENILNPTQE